MRLLTIEIWKRLSIVLIMLSASIVPAAPMDGLTINVSEEYGGFFRPGEWYPVVVSVDYRPKDGKPGDLFSGKLIVQSVSKEARADNYEFVRDIEVPAFSIQRFTLYAKFPDDLGARHSLQVRSGNGRLLQTFPLDALRPLEKNQILLVKVQRETSRLFFPGATGNVNAVTEAEIQDRNLSNHWAFYDPADILVFPQWPETQISSQQEEALLDWVAMGGTLVFLGGANSNTYAAAQDSPLLPVTTTSSRQYTANLSGFQRVPDGADLVKTKGFLVSDVEVKDDTEIIMDAGTDGASLPILVRRPHGLGQILFLSVDLVAPHQGLDQALRPYWLAVTPLPNIVDWEYAFAHHRKKTKSVTRGAAKPPNIILIILICIIYMGAVGPVNFFVLSKMNKVQYAWFTVPAIVFLFSGLIYAFGTLTKGGNYIGREISLYMANANDPVVAERSLVSIFTPRADTFFMMAENPKQTVADSDRWHEIEPLFESMSLQNFSSASAGFDFSSASPAIRTSNDQIGVASWGLRTFDTTQFELRGPRDLPGALEANLTYHNTSNELWFEGTIENNTGLDFYKAGLFFAGGGHDLGELKSGEKLERYRGDTGRPPKSLGGNWESLDDVIDGIVPIRSTDTDSDINRENARQILYALFRPDGSGELFPPLDGKLYFVGLAEDDELTVTTNFERNQGSRSIIYVAEINAKPAQQGFLIPEDAVQVRLHDYPGERLGFSLVAKDNYSNDESKLRMLNSYGILSLELPFHQPGLEAKTLTNNINVESSEQVFTAGAYSYNRRQFLVMDPTGSIDLNGIATPYSGRLWVQLSSEKKKAEEGSGSNFNIMSGVTETPIRDIEFSMTGTLSQN